MAALRRACVDGMRLVVVEGEPGVILSVRAADADDARRILTEDG